LAIDRAFSKEATAATASVGATTEESGLFAPTRRLETIDAIAKNKMTSPMTEIVMIQSGTIESA
jgi:hypothetical protein